MEPEGPNLPEKYRSDFDFIREVAEQVMKDAAMTGVEIHFSGNPLTAYSELTSQLNRELSRLLRSETHRIDALLYRVDLVEADIRTFRKSKNVQFLAHAILEREFIKVLTRKKFSGKG